MARGTGKDEAACIAGVLMIEGHWIDQLCMEYVLVC